MTRRVLVTGGAGYIGSVIVDQLLDRGWRVVVLDNLSRGHRAAVDRRALLIVGDVGDRAAVAAALAAPVEAVIHLAAFALVAESVREPARYRANNVAAGHILLDGAVSAGVRRFVFSSSCAVYGHPDPPGAPLGEDSPRKPVNPYGETKRDFEDLLADYGGRRGIAGISLRYFNAAGATAARGEDHDPETHLIPNVLRVALGQAEAVEIFGTDYATPDGTAVRDYVHVVDLADAHVRALDATLEGVPAVNLGTGTGYSVRDVVEAARRVTGAPIPAVQGPRRPGDPPALVAAVGRATALLGWRPLRSSLDDILRSAWMWHRAHPRGYDR